MPVLDNLTVPIVDEEPPKPVPPTEFMVFMGDFIYADVPVYFGDDKEAYRRLYRRNYNSPSFRKVYERLRTSLKCDSHLNDSQVLMYALQLSSIRMMITR